MNYISIPIIVTLCYMAGEVYKVLFKNKKNAYKLIPVFMATLGGLLGVFIYLTAPNIMANAENIWVALELGIVSGASATGTNQIIKQLFKINNDDKEK